MLSSIAIAAQCYTQQGNEQFKTGNVESALSFWRSGVASLEDFNEANSGGAQVKALVATLHTNLAMGYAKQAQWRDSAVSAGAALAVDPEHRKALFRRATAQRLVSATEGLPMDDLERCLAFRPI